MRKKIQFLTLFLGTIFLQAQVGINTESPKSTLDIEGKASETTTPDGIIAPRLTGKQLSMKNNVYTNNQKGSIVYITTPDPSPIGKTINVIQEGYYYFDGNIWQAITTSSTTEPWIETTTLNKQATASSNDIYRNHKVGLGDFSSTNATASLDIKTGGTVNSNGIPSTYGFKMQDGNQLYGRFLTSDDNGNGTWKDFYVYKRIGTVPSTGVPIRFIENTEIPSVRMYNSITLPPGPWEVEANVLLDSGSNPTDTYCWLRFSFTEENPATSPVPTTTTDVIASPDLVSINKQVSGNHVTNSSTIHTGGTPTLNFYSIVNGKVIINNQTNSNKTYYLYFVSGLCKGTPRSFIGVGASGYHENYISALRASLDYVP